MEKENLKTSKKGVILINKPAGITSHDVVDIARRKLRCRRVGHAGTLDPLAMGLLVVLVGTYTKMFSKFVNFDKVYTGRIKLGETTSTGDSEGKVIQKKECKGISEQQVREVFAIFQGAGKQVPPMVSALRKKGKRLYNLARKGLVVERKPRKINIYKCSLQGIELPYLDFYVHCSKGTYIRKLSEDIGNKLGCGAHVTKIIRRNVGPFSLSQAVKPEDIDEAHLQEFTF